MLGYLGPQGTFSHQAAVEWSRGGEELREYSTIYSAILAVENGEIDRAIVPIENSIEGSVNTTLDTLAFDVSLYITGEYVLHISQNLMVKRGAEASDIRLIASHPQAIGQSSRVLSRKFSDIPLEYTASTAAAAKRACESDGSIACIGSPSQAEIYGLDILIPDCGDVENNSTRFVIVDKNQNLSVSSRDKSSIAFTLENKPGSLYKALELFDTYRLNMIKIESRPVKTELGTYVFFIDIDGNIDDATIYFALDKLRQSTPFYKFLGSYHY